MIKFGTLIKSKRLYTSPHRSILFHFRKEEENLYMILSVKASSNQKEIKMSYYKMAKKYHPDFLHNESAKEKEEANEMFKKV